MAIVTQGMCAGIVSRESKGSKQSIEAQDDECLDAAEDLGVEVVEWYRDTVGASRFTDRPRKAWPLAVEDVRSGRVGMLIMYEASRAERVMDNWVPFLTMCRERGVLIHVKSADTTYDPRRPAHRRALIDMGNDAEHEVEKLSDRANKGIRKAVRMGKMHGMAPYGYTRVYDQADRKKFTEHPNDHAAIVKEIIERIARQDPIVVIQRDLIARGIPAPRGGVWSRKVIRQIAMNPAYIGKRRHRGELHDGSWPAIVGEATFNAAQQVLADPKRKATAPGAFRWLLSYTLRSECGGVMQARRRRAATNRPYYICLADGCVALGVWEVDEYITRLVTAWFARRGARRLFERSDADALEAKTRLAELERELEEWRDSAARPGGVSADAMARKERALVPLIEAEQKRIVQAAAPAAAMALLEAAEAEGSLIRPVWDGLSLAARRSVIASLMKEIRVRQTGERLTRWSSEEDRLRLAAERTEITWVAGAGLELVENGSPGR